MPLSTERKKQLRTIGHKLNPIVTIAHQGLTDSVLAELNRALDDHELIKVKLALTERERRHEAVALLQDMRGVEVVKKVGNTMIMDRAIKKTHPTLSNLLRYAMPARIVLSYGTR